MYSESSTEANSKSSILLYKENCIRPKLYRIEEKINEKILPRYSDRLFVAYSDETPNFDQMLKERDLNLRTGYSTVNMERNKVGLDSVPWGNTPYLPVNMMAFDMLEKQLNEIPADQAVKTIKLLSEVTAKYDRLVKTE